METKSNTSDNTLWSRTFITVAAANFLLFFSFYQLLPILPLYIIDKFQTDNATAGFIISLYTIGALACRPFAGFLVDTFSRKPLYFWTFFAFTLCFLGYKTVGLLPILAVVRFAHGLFFGISSTASNTVAIDALPASRRGEGIGYFGISVNLAFATGPMTGMFLYEAFGDGIVFAISTILCVIGLVLVQTLKVKPREKKVCAPLSLDRFFLTRAVPQFANFIFVGFAYGPVTNYIAIYANELGIGGTGWFYALIASGLILNRIMTGRLIDRGYLIHLVGTGMTLIVVAYFILAFSHGPNVREPRPPRPAWHGKQHLPLGMGHRHWNRYSRGRRHGKPLRDAPASVLRLRRRTRHRRRHVPRLHIKALSEKQIRRIKRETSLKLLVTATSARTAKPSVCLRTFSCRR